MADTHAQTLKYGEAAPGNTANWEFRGIHGGLPEFEIVGLVREKGEECDTWVARVEGILNKIALEQDLDVQISWHGRCEALFAEKGELITGVWITPDDNEDFEPHWERTDALIRVLVP